MEKPTIPAEIRPLFAGNNVYVIPEPSSIESIDELVKKRKDILILHSNIDDLGSKELELLEKILNAVKLTMDDVQIINHKITPLDFKTIASKFYPDVVMCFNITTLET